MTHTGRQEAIIDIRAFFDQDTATVTYVVSDPASRRCAIIDPVLDYDSQAGVTATHSADEVAAYVEAAGLAVDWILETHIHADHLTAAAYLKERLGGNTGIGDRIVDVLAYWVPVFDTARDTPADGSQFDRLFADGERFAIGGLTVRVMHTPGHTPACVSYLIGDAVFVGDTLFMPYVGTSRTDFPDGDAATLYRSIHGILSLPDSTRIFTAHDYPPVGQAPAWESTVAGQKRDNIMIRDGISEAQYVERRRARDATLAVPRLILPSLQVNLRAGGLGQPNENGTQYIRIPLNVLKKP
ncbi:MAG TPA: MBL fold metallo-hydrolase [Mariprofundaceae bacterium]|nr:MBL fold metallo-hydrolase [Mariprofundaceae bacterium]